MVTAFWIVMFLVVGVFLYGVIGALALSFSKPIALTPDHKPKTARLGEQDSQ
jgi:hypothetical protein